MTLLPLPLSLLLLPSRRRSRFRTRSVAVLVQLRRSIPIPIHVRPSSPRRHREWRRNGEAACEVGEPDGTRRGSESRRLRSKRERSRRRTADSKRVRRRRCRTRRRRWRRHPLARERIRPCESGRSWARRHLETLETRADHHLDLDGAWLKAKGTGTQLLFQRRWGRGGTKGGKEVLRLPFRASRETSSRAGS